MMIIRILNNNDTSVLDEYLARQWQYTMFMRANMARAEIEYTAQPFSSDYIGAFDNKGAMVGVLSHNWKGGIMVCIDNHTVLQELIDYFKNMVNRPITAIMGDDKCASILQKQLGILNADYRVNRLTDLYYLNLNQLSMPVGFDFSSVKMVLPDDSHKDILLEWMLGFEEETMELPHTAQQKKAIQNKVETILKTQTHWILLADGVPVSLSGFNAMLADVVQVGPLWTPPEHRGWGYARALVALTLAHIKETGVEKTVVFTASPAAKKAYQSIGYERIGQYKIAILQ